MNKHTPGPWEIVNLSSVVSALGADSGDGCAADQYDCWQVAECGYGQTLAGGQMTSLGFDVVKANALLIAAAPCMLKELTVIRDTLPHIGLDASTRTEMLRRIDSVINKATA